MARARPPGGGLQLVLDPLSSFVGRELAAVGSVEVSPPHARMTRMQLSAMADLGPHVLLASCVPSPPFFESHDEAAKRLWTAVWNHGLDLVVCLDRGPEGYWPSTLAIPTPASSIGPEDVLLKAKTEGHALRSQLARARESELECCGLRLEAEAIGLDAVSADHAGGVGGELLGLLHDWYQRASPEEQSVLQGSLQVRVVRVFHTGLTRETPPHSLVHLCVDNWPDFGTPRAVLPCLIAARLLLHSLARGRVDETSTPPRTVGGGLVHCMAGIGRTGTLLLFAQAFHRFIGAHRPSAAPLASKVVEPFVNDGFGDDTEAEASAAKLPFPRQVRLGQMLLEMRTQRSSAMVENARQLQWVYSALLECADTRGWRPVKAVERPPVAAVERPSAVAVERLGEPPRVAPRGVVGASFTEPTSSRVD
jgi:hypothetical protein